MTTTLVVLLITVAMFIWGRIRSDVVAMTALVTLMVAGILTPEEALSGFSSPIVVMMVGLFIVGGAVLQTGLAQNVGNRIASLARGNETRAFVLVMLATSFIGAFVSNTGTVALMMPIVMSMAARSGIRSSRLLMPLAFAGSLGGMLTLIGTPPNLVINEVLVGHGYPSLKFFSFLPVGLIVIAMGILMLLPLSKLLVKKKEKGRKTGRDKSPGELISQYRLTGRLHKYAVGKGNKKLAGRKVRDLDLQGRYGVSIIEIRNVRRKPLGKDISQSMAWADSVIQGGDILYLMGPGEGMERLAADYGLTDMRGASLDFYDLGVTEIIVLPTSRLIGMRLRDSRLREDYALNVLGIRRGDDHLTEGLGDRKLHNGDVLLVQGQWDDLLRLNGDNSDWVVMGRPEKSMDKVLLDYKAPVAGAIMLLMVLLMVFDFIPVAPVTAVLIAALLTIFTGCFRSAGAALKTINWESIILIAAMMPMSTALEKTGVSQMVSEGLVGSLGQLGPTALLAGVYFTTSLLTMFISNTATAVLMAPIAFVAAEQVGASPYPFLFAVTLGASMCFASPFSTPPNALVMKAGHYTFMDYVRVGLPLQVAIGIVMTLLLPLIC